MSRLLLFVLLLYVVSSCVSTKSCIIQDKKDDLDIRVIELDDSLGSSIDSSETEIVELHLPDRKKREIDNQAIKRSKDSCRDDDDCGPGRICFAHLACLKGRLRTVKSQESTPIETRT
ncbi:uncharacterized protein LOC109855852 [Pseudomyrmex gracilis]|uniref:uncharacterized protein LOC109855852 n=1 Tax=Pseudomyrmex gracilis TaxID=219809 RepID=UPI000995BBA7|nr:uncharacterized protein LOC109855852 [Pseudomyrmex gracilis]